MTADSNTAGTKYEATTSASRWIGARLRWASLTIFTICASRVSAPTRSVFMTKLPVPLIVPPVTLASTIFSTGMGSPLTIDSSTELVPSITMPSVGTFSPGRTRSLSPTWIAFKSTSCSVPSAAMRRAVFGASPRSALIAPLVWLRAFNSRTCPRRTSTVMTAAASK